MSDLSVSTATSTATTTSSAAMSSLTEDFDQFLSLLVTQLENQSPLDPMDSSELTNQLVGFAQVEQQINTNAELENISSLLSGSSVGSAMDYLHQTVTYSGDTTVVQDGTAQWTYDLDTDADSVALVVSDAYGNLIWAGEGSTQAGPNGLQLTGDALEGVEDGETLVLTVSAVDESDNTIDVETYAVAEVTGVDTSTGDPLLYVGGGITVSTDSIVAIS